MSEQEFENALFESLTAYFNSERSYIRRMDDLAARCSTEQWDIVVDTFRYLDDPEYYFATENEESQKV